MKRIEDKSFVKARDDKPKEEVPSKVITISETIKEPSFRVIGDSLMKKEHPKLAELYTELNNASDNLFTLGHRSHDLKRQYTNDVEFWRKKIREYEKNEGITRDDHIRWSGFQNN